MFEILSLHQFIKTCHHSLKWSEIFLKILLHLFSAVFDTSGLKKAYLTQEIQSYLRMFPVLLKSGVELLGLEADQWLIGPRPHSGHSSNPRMGGLLLHHSSGPAAAAAGEPCALRMMDELTDRTQVEWQEPNSNDSMNERNALTRLTSSESQDPSTFCHHSQLISGKYFPSRNPSLPFLNSPKYPCPVLTKATRVHRQSKT